MTLNGSSFIISIALQLAARSRAWTTKDGVNFTEITSKLPSASTQQALNCNLSPDGSQAIVTYLFVNTTNTIDYSVDGGSSFTAKSFVFNASASGGVPVATYLLPNNVV